MALLTRGFGVAFAMALLSIEFIAPHFTLARQNKQKQARKTNKRNQAGKTQRANAGKFSQTKQVSKAVSKKQSKPKPTKQKQTKGKISQRIRI